MRQLGTPAKSTLNIIIYYSLIYVCISFIKNLFRNVNKKKKKSSKSVAIIYHE